MFKKFVKIEILTLDLYFLGNRSIISTVFPSGLQLTYFVCSLFITKKLRIESLPHHFPITEALQKKKKLQPLKFSFSKRFRNLNQNISSAAYICTGEIVGNKAKGDSQNGCYQGVRNVRFSENLTDFVFLKHQFRD